MNTKNKITYESVATAAQELLESGVQPSVRKVISVIGGGSPNSVLEHLNSWKSGQPSAGISDFQLDHRIQNLFAEQIQKAVSAARADIEILLAGVQDDLETVSKEAMENEAEVTRLAGELEARNNQVAQLTGAMNLLNADIERMKSETFDAISKAEGRAATEIEKAEFVAQRERKDREAAQIELAKTKLQLESMPKLEAQIEHLRAELDSERKERSVVESRAAGAQATAVALTNQVDDLKDLAAQSAVAAESRVREISAGRDALVAELRKEIQRLTPVVEDAIDIKRAKLR